MSWKQPLKEMQGKTAYIRPKVAGPFPGPYASGNYMHRAALFYITISDEKSVLYNNSYFSLCYNFSSLFFFTLFSYEKTYHVNLVVWLSTNC
jgi:hypothetical protein